MVLNNIYITGLIFFIVYHTLVFMILRKRMSFLKIVLISILILPVIDVLYLFLTKLIHKEPSELQGDYAVYVGLTKVYAMFVANVLSISLGVVVVAIKLFVRYKMTKKK